MTNVLKNNHPLSERKELRPSLTRQTNSPSTFQLRLVPSVQRLEEPKTAQSADIPEGAYRQQDERR